MMEGTLASIDGRERTLHVASMRCQRALTLLLLFCGLSTTPFFSLEQSPHDGLTATSVPQCGARILGKSFEEGGSELGDPHDIRGLFGPDPVACPSWMARWSSALPVASVPSTAPLVHPVSGAERLTYHANAPPALSEVTS